MVKTVRDYDEERVKDYKEDIDTLLVFVSRLITFVVAQNETSHHRPAYFPPY